MIFNPLMLYGALGVGVVVLGLGIAVKVQSARLESAKAETVAVQGQFDAFVAQAKVIGEQQEAKTKAEDLANRKRQEAANAENLKTRTALIIALDSLRKSTPDPRSRSLPSAPAGSARPDLACFDRAEYQREDGVALEKLFAGARSLADEGTAATIDLNTARSWAVSR